MAPGNCTFMGIPPELREMVYAFAFSSNDSAEAKPIDHLLRQAVPNSINLRRVSKQIYFESRRTYRKARKLLIDQRQQAITKVTDYYDTVLAAVPASALPHVLTSLVENLKGEHGPCQNHTCVTTDCYMCSNPQHQACFDCGRNLAVALHCKMQPEDKPQLVGSEGDGTALPGTMGALLATLPVTYTRQVRPHLRTGQPTLSSSWAFCWWHCTFQRQRALDLRCGVRKRAVQKFWSVFEGHETQVPCVEHMIKQLESTDPRWPDVEHIRTTVCKGVLDWEGTYTERVKKWVEGGERTEAYWVPKKD